MNEWILFIIYLYLACYFLAEVVEFFLFDSSVWFRMLIIKEGLFEM